MHKVIEYILIQKLATQGIRANVNFILVSNIAIHLSGQLQLHIIIITSVMHNFNIEVAHFES